MIIFYKYAEELIPKRVNHPSQRTEFIREQTDINLAQPNHGQIYRKVARQLWYSPQVVLAVAQKILFLRWSSLDLYAGTRSEAALPTAV